MHSNGPNPSGILSTVKFVVLAGDNGGCDYHGCFTAMEITDMIYIKTQVFRLLRY